MDFIYTLLHILNEMSPYIMLGFLIAGVLHSFVPASTMSRHLSGSGFKSVVKGALIGVPLPLCSCGVLPTAVALHRGGASKAASSAFLIATPQTGVDSIVATWSLLGPAFAIIRPVAALITSIWGGMIVGATDRNRRDDRPITVRDEEASPAPTSFMKKAKESIIFGFHTMVGSIGRWLVIGLVIAALITIFVPANFLSALGDRPLLAMLAVVVVAVPMYVCATGSIPIALSLMLKGLSPGAAFVLLMAGPAANFASIAIISKSFGKKAAAAYIASIVGGAIAFGLIIDYALPREWFIGNLVEPHGACHHEFPFWSTFCSGLLLILLAISFVPRIFKRKTTNLNDMTKIYKINGMSCAHCKASVEKNLSKIDGVESVVVDLSVGTASVEGEHSAEAVYAMIEEIGFDAVRE